MWGVGGYIRLYWNWFVDCFLGFVIIGIGYYSVICKECCRFYVE